jgi:hypothetical protein
MRALAWIGVLAGCSFHGASDVLIDAAGDNGGSDALVDAALDAQLVVASDARFCLGSGLIQVCLDAEPTTTMALSGTLSTQSAGCLVITQADGREVCVIAHRMITVGSVLTVTGTRPLVLLASQTITVSAGGIDVSTVRNPARVGAGADWAGCPSEVSAAVDNVSGGGGGGGGSFGTAGGAGGIGNFQQAVQAPGGMPPAAQLPAVVRAGCPGGNGGNGTIANSSGIAGHSGGALYLLAGTQITVGGALLANGEGGGGGGEDGGGAGGGAGGLIGLEAPMITVSALVAANGGGGGEGGDANITLGDPGNPGADGIATITTPAAGGSGPPAVAGDGGDGAVAALPAGPGANQSAGGGGGGGATGVIYVKGALSGGMFSPAPSLH